MSDAFPQDPAFAARLWREITPIYRAILDHPFVTGLADGTLSRDRFVFYVVQDGLYLVEFARALSLAAAKAPSERWVKTFDEHAVGTLTVERDLHRSFLQELGLSEQTVRTTPRAPTTLAYASHILSVAYGRPAHEVVAALAPCYWVYWEVGKALVARGSPDSLYRRWIATYADEAFGGMVEDVLRLLDQLARSSTEAQRDAMRERFITSTRYEWMFWEMGYRMEPWPV